MTSGERPTGWVLTAECVCVCVCVCVMMNSDKIHSLSGKWAQRSALADNLSTITNRHAAASTARLSASRVNPLNYRKQNSVFIDSFLKSSIMSSHEAVTAIKAGINRRATTVVSIYCELSGRDVWVLHGDIFTLNVNVLYFVLLGMILQHICVLWKLWALFPF